MDMGPRGTATSMQNKQTKVSGSGQWPPKQVGNLVRQHRVDPLCHRPALHPLHEMCRRLQYMHITVDDIYIAY